MVKRSPERLQFLHDIMTHALEGGVGYWSIADSIDRSGTPEQRKGIHFDWNYERYTLYCFDGDQDPKTWEKLPGECALSTNENPIDKCEGHEVNPEIIAKGLGLATKTYGVGEPTGWQRHIIEANRENDGAEIDSGDADNLVQLGIFGKVVYA